MHIVSLSRSYSINTIKNVAKTFRMNIDLIRKWIRINSDHRFDDQLAPGIV